MSQHFHIYGSTEGGRSLARQPIVLARIPHVGAQAGAEVGAVAEAELVGPSAPAPAVESRPGALSKGTRFYVDSQHKPAPTVEPESHRQPEQQSLTSGHRRRHDAHGRHWSPESSTDGSLQPGLPSGLSRLHGELSSYSALIVTLALVAAGALLYWMTIAPNQEPVVDYNDSYETFGSAEIKIPEFAPRTGPPAELQFASPSLPIDPLDPSRAKQFSETKSAAATAETFDEQTFTGNDVYRTAESRSPGEHSALPGTTAESASEQIRLPEQTPAQADEPEPVFNDASAQAYPVTDHPIGWDFTRLNETDIAEVNAAAPSSEPEMAQRATPPMPTPVNR